MTMQAKQDAIKTTWWLIRHGPVVNPDNLIYGKADHPIQPLCPKLHAPLAMALPDDAIYLTSTRRRTMQTLRDLVGLKGEATPSFEALDSFDEQSFGAWEAQTWDCLFQSGESHEFWLAPASARPPMGESFEDVMVRVAGGLQSQSIRHAGKNIILFSHGGSIRAAIAHALKLDGETALRFSIDHCSLTCLVHWRLADDTETWQVTKVNLGPSDFSARRYTSGH